MLTVTGMFVLSQGDLAAGQLKDLQADIEYTKSRIERKEAAIERIKKSIEEMSGDYEKRAGEVAKMKEVSESSHAAGVRAKELEYSIRQKLAVLSFYNSNSGRTGFKSGAEFDEVKLESGRVLKNVMIDAVKGQTVKVKHSGGFADIPVTDLPRSVRGNLLVPPESHDISGLPFRLFKQRPEMMGELDMFARTLSVERRQAEKRLADEMAAAQMKRERDLQDYRSKQLAMHEEFLAERREVARLRDEQRQAVIDGNREIDDQLIVLFKQLDDLALQSEEVEKGFNMKIVEYDRVGSTRLPPSEEKRRIANVNNYLKAKEDLIQRSARIRKKIIELRAQKK